MARSDQEAGAVTAGSVRRRIADAQLYFENLEATTFKSRRLIPNSESRLFDKAPLCGIDVQSMPEEIRDHQ
jgi:hypothetical protein